ncbi:hypothetical protein D9M69_693670 [compost metagenome]
MAAAGFGVALHQRCGAGVQEDHAQAGAHGAQRGHHVRQLGQFAGRADVDRDGNPLQAFVPGVGNEFGQEPYGQIVDTGIAGVLEHAQGDGLAGARDAGD